jgi:hypothetical protein
VITLLMAIMMPVECSPFKETGRSDRMRKVHIA